MYYVYCVQYNNFTNISQYFISISTSGIHKERDLSSVPIQFSFLVNDFFILLNMKT